ncbi:MAG: hypothetical protein ABGY75_03970 [Gemmataceae bacterium]
MSRLARRRLVERLQCHWFIPEENAMSVEGRITTSETPGNVNEVLAAATGDELLEIARQAGHKSPLAANFNNPNAKQFYQQRDMLLRELTACYRNGQNEVWDRICVAAFGLYHKKTSGG